MIEYLADNLILVLGLVFVADFIGGFLAGWIVQRWVQ